MRRRGFARFSAAVRRELTSWGVTRPCPRIIRAVFDAMEDTVGLVGHRRGTFERAGFVIDDWRHARAQREEVEARMLTVLDQLELTELVSSIPGLSPVGAAGMLAETGDPTRFTSRARWSNTPVCARATTAAASAKAKAVCPGGGRPELRAAA